MYNPVVNSPLVRHMEITNHFLNIMWPFAVADLS